MAELDKMFGFDAAMLLHNNVSAFFDYIWERNMAVDEFVIGFHARHDKISDIWYGGRVEGPLTAVPV